MRVCSLCGAPINEATLHCSRFPICRYIAKDESVDDGKNYIVFDLETTGLSRDKDRIIEIGAVKVQDDEIIDRFSMLVNPGTDEMGNAIYIPPNIVDLTGIDYEMVRNQPVEQEAVRQFLEWTKGYTCFAGQNIKTFDIPFMKAAAKRAHMSLNVESFMDTMLAAKRMDLKGRHLVDNYQQPTLAKHYNFTYNAHRAVDDCEACFRILLGLKKEGLNYGIKIVPEKL